MRHDRPNLRFVLVLLAGLFAVMQTLTVAQAATRPTVLLDAFGNPLCVSTGDHEGPVDADHALAGCCKLACVAAAALPPPPPAEPAQVVWHIAAAIPRIAAVCQPLSGRTVFAGSPRAPPTEA